MHLLLITVQILNKQKKIRELEGIGHLPIRSIERKFEFSGSGYAEIDIAVSSFVDSHLKKNDRNNPLWSSPNYSDILEVVSGKPCVSHLSSQEVAEVAKNVHVSVGRKIKEMRNLETKQVFMNYELDEDFQNLVQPEETDPELLEKLKENDKLKKDEGVVIEEFMKKVDSMTTEEKAALEVGETSASETGDESDEEDSEAEASLCEDSEFDEEEEYMGEVQIIEDDDDCQAGPSGVSVNETSEASSSHVKKSSGDHASSNNGRVKRDFVFLDQGLSDDEADKGGGPLKKLKVAEQDSSPPEVVDLCDDDD